MASKAGVRRAEVEAVLKANPDGLNIWQVCRVANMKIDFIGPALDELKQAGRVEFVEPDLWKLIKPETAERD